VSGFGLQYVVGYLLATQCSTLWNFAWIEWWAFRAPALRGTRFRRWAMLMALNNAANVATVPMFVFCTSVLGINYLLSNIMTLGVVMLVRFALANRIWSSKNGHVDARSLPVHVLAVPDAAPARDPRSA
jgi:putative flippase GtrA